jgi:hypothetical protein
MVDTADRAWTQSSGNPYWLSMENEGFTLAHPLHKTHTDWHVLTDKQIEFNAQILARLHRDHGVPLRLARSTTERGLAYHSLGAETGVAWGHDDCPGEPIKAQLPAILARAIEIVGGANMSTTDDIKSAIWYSNLEQAKPNGPSAGTVLLTLAEQMPDVLAKLDTLIARPAADVDEAALAVALAPLLDAGATAAEVAAAVRAELDKTRLAT